jgi:hypothetical protein
MRVATGLSVAVLATIMSAPLPAAQLGAPRTMDAIAEQYVKLVLALGAHDKDYVDAYYGPPEWRQEAEAAKRPLADVRAAALALLEELTRSVTPAAGDGGNDDMVRLRHQYLVRQLQSLVSRTEMLSGKKMSFDEESQALYDSVAPTHAEPYFKNLTREIDAALPGTGPLVTRYGAFRDQFNIPKDKVDAVFKAAIAECRRRTLQNVALPAGETFTVEYVTGKSWSAYNWYQGNYKSLIQVNVEQPITIDRAIDLACHEGYPGHHVYNVLLEKNLVRDRGWKEFTVYPLFSPQSLIAEGTANYGIEVAFPGDERTIFERDVLFPLAGLDPRKAAEYHRVQQLAARLSYAGNEAARLYLEGRTDAAGATAWLEAYGLSAAAKAQQRIRFFDQYRSYVINYNLGQDLVRAYIESRGGTPRNPGKRWEEFKALLASPRLPGGLRPIAVK